MRTERLVQTNHTKFEGGQDDEYGEHDERDERVALEMVGRPVAHENGVEGEQEHEPWRVDVEHESALV